MEISKITRPSDWVYFAKGSANMLFKYAGANDYLRHKLLRVRLLKQTSQYISTCELYDFIELECKRLFPHEIVEVLLVVLTTDFVNRLDSKGNKLMLLERYGLLIPNILDGDYQKHLLSKKCLLYYNRIGPQHATLSVIFEIKPKWLYDNYSTNYCRTCLLNQLRGCSRHFCPLDFLYPERINQVLADIFAPVPPPVMTHIEINNRIPVKALFKAYLADPDNVFRQLKRYQCIYSQKDLIRNLLSEQDVLKRLSLVMTLRDVGLFIKFEKYDAFNHCHTSHNNVHRIISVEGYGEFLVTCSIYDLDLKSNAKFKHWIDTEKHQASVCNSHNPDWPHCYKPLDLNGSIVGCEFEMR